MNGQNVETRHCPLCDTDIPVGAGHSCWTVNLPRELPRLSRVAILDDLTDLKAQLAEAVSVLKLVEWSDGRQAVGPDDWCCPVCEATKQHGHAPDCRLAKVIGG